MSPLHLLCTLLIACEPLPSVPVPMEQVEPDLAPPSDPAEALPAAPDPQPVIDDNRAPVILSITLEPATPKTLDDITVRVESEDPDRDYVRYEYTWLVNEVEIRGLRQPMLPHTYFAKGDMVQTRVLAKDREYEVEGFSPLLIVRNTPPEIVSKPGSLRSIDGHQVQAQDIDSDELSFSLEGHPEGMSIDARSGTLSYQGSESAREGTYQVSVVVEDPEGGSARWSFGITVAAGSGADQPTQSQPSEAEQRHRSRGYRPDKEAEEQPEEE